MRIDKHLSTKVVVHQHANFVGWKVDYANNLQDVRYIAGSIIGNKKGIFEVSVSQDGGYHKSLTIKN
jgi:hypothetical protein